MAKKVRTVKDVYDTMNIDQQNIVALIIDKFAEQEMDERASLLHYIATKLGLSDVAMNEMVSEWEKTKKEET